MEQVFNYNKIKAYPPGQKLENLHPEERQGFFPTIDSSGRLSIATIFRITPTNAKFKIVEDTLSYSNI